MDNQEALNVQPGHIIKRTDAVPTLYFSESVGRDFGQPAGGWSEDKARATILTEDAAEHLLATTLVNQAPFCVVVSHG